MLSCSLFWVGRVKVSPTLGVGITFPIVHVLRTFRVLMSGQHAVLAGTTIRVAEIKFNLNNRFARFEFQSEGGCLRLASLLHLG